MLVVVFVTVERYFKFLILVYHTMAYLLWTLSAARSGLWLELDDCRQNVVRLVLCKRYVGVVMQSKDLRGVIYRQTLDVRQVSLNKRPSFVNIIIVTIIEYLILGRVTVSSERFELQ